MVLHTPCCDTAVLLIQISEILLDDKQPQVPLSKSMSFYTYTWSLYCDLFMTRSQHRELMNGVICLCLQFRVTSHIILYPLQTFHQCSWNVTWERVAIVQSECYQTICQFARICRIVLRLHGFHDQGFIRMIMKYISYSALTNKTIQRRCT